MYIKKPFRSNNFQNTNNFFRENYVEEEEGNKKKNNYNNNNNNNKYKIQNNFIGRKEYDWEKANNCKLFNFDL